MVQAKTLLHKEKTIRKSKIEDVGINIEYEISRRYWYRSWRKRIVWSGSRDEERVNKKIQIIKLH